MTEKIPTRPAALGPSATPKHASAPTGCGNSKNPDSRRHKRVKVVRACEGCRRRKIRCDSATTNTWPCAACSRLRLTCIPPKMPFENASHSAAAAIAAAPAASLQTTFALVKPRTSKDSPSSAATTPQRISQAANQSSNSSAFSARSLPAQQQPFQSPDSAQNNSAFGSALSFVYQQMPESTQGLPLVSGVDPDSDNPFGYYSLDRSSAATPGSGVATGSHQFQPNFYQVEETDGDTDNGDSEDSEVDDYQDVQQSEDSGNSNGESDDAPAASITEAMGDLKIELDAVAPYIKYQGKRDTEASNVVEEPEPVILNAFTEHLKIQIPPEMMPSDERAHEYFNYFFKHIHPYAPVLNSSQFYHQWRNDRTSISPFLLDGIFACASMAMDGVKEGSKWLAVAARHEESCKNASSLSTIQGMILCLKAQESSPKRGYFYRSWMTIVNMVAMAKDLELDQHHELHQAGQSCSDPSMCGIKYRVWHMLFILEPMVGGPQGRSFLDFGVKIDTVDFHIPISFPGFDEFEMQISRQFTAFLRVVRNVAISGQFHQSLRKKTRTWPLEPAFIAHNDDFPVWIDETPADLRVSFPTDGSPPNIVSAFMANITCYHYLSTIMQRRPQIETLMALNDPSWKPHFAICYDAAQKMCRIQEVVLEQYGLEGMSNMQRGMNFSIYCILTCVMLHLVAITSPDRETNKDARDYFVRHMRILEKCAPLFPLPEMQTQVNALREAFSADTSKPFELKKGLGSGGKRLVTKSSPKEGRRHNVTKHLKSMPAEDLTGSKSNSKFLSADNVQSAGSLSSPHSMASVDLYQKPQTIQTPEIASAISHPADFSDMIIAPDQWNPSQIFHHWNTAFGTPPPLPPATPQSAASPLSRIYDSGNSSFEISSPSSDIASSNGPIPCPVDQSVATPHSGTTMQPLPTGPYNSPHQVAGAYQQPSRPDNMHLQFVPQMGGTHQLQNANQPYERQFHSVQQHDMQGQPQQPQMTNAFTAVPSSGVDPSVVISPLHSAGPQIPRPQYVTPLMWQQVVENAFIQKNDAWPASYDDQFILEGADYSPANAQLVSPHDLSPGQ